MTKVHDSCGCVFCDVDLEPELRDGKPVHPVCIRRDGKESIGWAHCWKRATGEARERLDGFHNPRL